MSKNRKIVVFPFSVDSLFLIDIFEQFCPEYEISSLVAPPGLGLTDMDAGMADNRKNTGYIVKDDFESALNYADTFFVTGGDCQEFLHSNTLKAINKAIEMRKDIICSLTLEETQLKKIRKRASEKNVEFKYYAENMKMKVDFSSAKLMVPRTFDAPVILVGGTLEQNNVFEIFIKLVMKLRKKGLRVSAISQKSEAAFLFIICWTILNLIRC